MRIYPVPFRRLEEEEQYRKFDWVECRRVDGEPVALEKVRRKYWDEFMTKDLHLFLGTTQQFHFWATNPWVIIGVFSIPPETQLSLFG